VVNDDPVPSEPAEFASVEAAFLALESPLLRHARRFSGSEDMAQDLVQEAFLRLHAEFGAVREARPWLYRTVHNLALNHRRNANRLKPLEDPDNSKPPASQGLVDSRPLPDEQAARREGIDQVRLGLDALPERDRELLALKFQENLSYKEISARTGLTVGHVGYLLHHALKALAAELDKAGVLR
jgi:RNA polymerase sigma-70 factor (ECF subfamily)